MIGYIVEVTGTNGDSVVGNVYSVGNYANHAQYVRENSLVMDSVSLTYADTWGINAGKTITVPRHEYDKDRHMLMSESGNVVKIKYHASESVQTMADRLQKEKDNNMAVPVGDTKEHLQKLETKLEQIRGVTEVSNNESVPSAVLINGEAKCFDTVIAIGSSDYPFFVGEVNAVHKLGTEEHHSGNLTDDVFVDFQSDEYSEERKREIEAHFSKLLGKSQRFDEDIAPDICNVQISPEHLLYVKESEMAMLLESRSNCEAFCNEILNNSAEIMPDQTITTADRDAYGYAYDGMLPLNQDRAMDLYMQDHEIFLLFDDDTESAVEDSSQITEHDGIFGIERECWQKSETRKDMVSGMNHDKTQPSAIATQKTETATTKETPEKQTPPPKKARNPYRDGR